MKMLRYRAPEHAPETDFDKDLEKLLDKLFGALVLILNNGLKVDENFNAEIVTVTTDATPGTEVAAAHTLKRVPIGYLVLGRNKEGVIYDGATANSSSNIYLKSNVASVTATVMIL